MAFTLGGGYETRSGRIEALQRLLAGFSGPQAPPGLAIPQSTGGASGAGGSGVSGVGESGGLTGANAAGQSASGTISGFDAGLAGLGLSFLGNAVPGLNAASALGALGPQAATMSGVPSSLTMNTDQGPLAVTNLTNTQGLLGAVLSGRVPSLTNIANSTVPTLSALAQSIFSGPQFAAQSPDMNLSQSIYSGALAQGLSPAQALAAAQMGEANAAPAFAVTSNAMSLGLSGIGGQAGSHGAIGTGQMSGFGGPTSGPSPTVGRGATDDPTANDPTASPVDDANSGIPSVAPPDDGGGGGGGGGGSHICGALYRRGMLTREDLAANEMFRRRMTPQEYAGYSAWAVPLVRFADAHPRMGRLLAVTLGRLALCYMREIRKPGSSRLGALLLRVGLPVCRRLGAKRVRFITWQSPRAEQAKAAE